MLQDGNKAVKIRLFEKALKSDNVHICDFIEPYVDDLKNVIDMDIIRQSGLKIAADALGGSGFAYWQ